MSQRLTNVRGNVSESRVRWSDSLEGRERLYKMAIIPPVGEIFESVQSVGPADQKTNQQC